MIVEMRHEGKCEWKQWGMGGRWERDGNRGGGREWSALIPSKGFRGSADAPGILRVRLECYKTMMISSTSLVLTERGGETHLRGSRAVGLCSPERSASALRYSTRHRRTLVLRFPLDLPTR
jgi:hypothetical protein